MKKNNQNITDKNRNNNNNRNKNGRDGNTNNISKDCTTYKCKVASSCSSANKTVQEIERYTKEAENLVEALSALTKLAEQLKPCLATKSQCSQNASNSNDIYSDASSYEDDNQKEIEEPDSDPKILVVTKRHQEEPKVVPKVRSEPERAKPTIEATGNYCLCHCSSLQQNKISFKEDKVKPKKQDDDDDGEKCGCCGKQKQQKNSDNEKTGCCPKKKSKDKNRETNYPQKEKPSKTQVVELKPLPMPSMTILHPVENPTPIVLKPMLTYNEPFEEVTNTYPTVSALTTKAALNLDDKEMQAGGGRNQSEVGSMTEPVQFLGSKAIEGCSTCCQMSCGKMDTRDVGTDKAAITLDAIPFEEFAENDCFQYWYEDAAQCKCAPTSDTKTKLPPTPQPPNNQVSIQTRQTNQPSYPPPPHQQQQQLPAPSSMMDCYPYYHGMQPPMQYQNAAPIDYGPRQMYTEPIGINAVNYDPPGGVVYRACRAKGSRTEPQKMQGYQEIDCVPSCQSTANQNWSHVSAPSTMGSTNHSQTSPNSKKVVQYDQQQYEYYESPPKSNYKFEQPAMNYPNISYAPCYENIPQRSGMLGRAPENYSSNRRNVSGSQYTGVDRDCYQRQLNQLMSQHYNTLFAGKADRNMEESIRRSDTPNSSSSRGNMSQCSGSCTYQNKPMNKKK